MSLGTGSLYWISRTKYAIGMCVCNTGLLAKRKASRGTEDCSNLYFGSDYSCCCVDGVFMHRYDIYVYLCIHTTCDVMIPALHSMTSRALLASLSLLFEFPLSTTAKHRHEETTKRNERSILVIISYLQSTILSLRVGIVLAKFPSFP